MNELIELRQINNIINKNNLFYSDDKILFNNNEYLLKSIKHGEICIAKKLININIDINIVDNYNNNAIQYFIDYINLIGTIDEDKQIEFLNLLLASGININNINKCGQNALFKAVKYNNLTIVKFLIDHKINLTEDIMGNCPLTYAFKINNIEIIKLILSYISEINYKFSDININKYLLISIKTKIYEIINNVIDKLSYFIITKNILIEIFNNLSNDNISKLLVKLKKQNFYLSIDINKNDKEEIYKLYNSLKNDIININLKNLIFYLENNINNIKSYNSECYICQNESIINSSYIQIPCKHLICKSCYLEMINYTYKCGICKADIKHIITK